MSSDVMVKVEGVSKKYCRNLKRSLRYGLQDLADELLLHHSKSGELRRQEFWALRDVSFELRRGESLGIIGVNGSGKTTLMMMLQGLIKPTKGKITMRGHVEALIRLGAGFEPILTGRENIYINAAILGISKQEVNRKLDEVLAFADIGDFIDAPVRTYSSGMKARLGFSVATNLACPDVLLVDEVLATGDIAFRHKCMQRIKDIIEAGTAVILVSHAMPQIERLCQKVLLLNKGVVEGIGPTTEIRQQYYEITNIIASSLGIKKIDVTASSGKNKQRRERSLNRRRSFKEYCDSSLLEFAKVELLNEAREPQNQFRVFETFVVRIHFIIHQPLKSLKVNFQILSLNNVCVSTLSSRGHAQSCGFLGSECIECLVSKPPLGEGDYQIGFSIWAKSTKIFSSRQVANLSIIPEAETCAQTSSNSGLIYLSSSWNFNALTE